MKLHFQFLGICLLAVVQSVTAYAEPFITGFSPAAGSPGDKVMLTGSGFTTSGPLIIRFWSGVVATQGTVTSDSLINLTVPNGISSGPISIQGSGGAEHFTADDFTAVGSGPYIMDVSPPYGKTNDLVVISGVHFTGVTRTGVSFNGVAAGDAAANADGSQINVHVPFGATSGPVKVTTPFGSSNAPVAFTVIGAGPFITGFSPQVGTVATTVFIDGVHFTGATNATFNGKPGVNFAAQSDTAIRVDVPAGVTSGPITVNTPLGSFTTSSNFFVPPSVMSFSPGLGRAGTNVVIIGANLRGATAVSFNGKAAAYTVVNNTNISATVPVGASTGTLRVTAPAGSAFSSSNFVVQPVITGFSPNFGPAGSSVVISGANLDGAPAVKFNGVAAALTQTTFGQLTATVPSGTVTGPISVTTTNGGYTNSAFFYLPASVVSFTPSNSPPGTRVTISGQNFTDASAVSFNGTSAPIFTVSNNTTLGVTVPEGVTTGPISVTTPAGPATSAKLFYAAPVITGFTPTHGLPGTNVTITGSSFLGATAVKFGAVSAQFTVVNNGQITATVPGSAITAPITVSAPGGTNTSAASFILDYFTDLAVTITSSPNPVIVGSNLLYTIKVMNNGPLSAPNLRLTNMLPANTALRSLAAPSGWSFVTNGNPIEGVIGSLAANASATITMTVTPQVAGTITNAASLGSDYSDPGVSNNVAASTTVVLPLALLSIHHSPGQIQVSWPNALTNYVLESRTRLSSDTSWSSVTSSPSVSGNLKIVTITNPVPSSYYRLRN